MFKCWPKAAARSNSRARLTSKKWKCEPTCTGRSPVLRTFSAVTGSFSWNETASFRHT